MKNQEKSLLFIVTVLCTVWSTSAQTVSQTAIVDNAPPSVKLPPAFKKFTATEVLKLIFSDYDSATGRTAKILNDDGKPGKAILVEAETWQAQNQECLVVLVDIKQNEEILGKAKPGLRSGPLGYDVGLALLQKNSDRMELIAYTDLKYSFKNRYWSAFLELAFYKLSTTETLIGVRYEDWHPNSQRKILTLYRVENNSLRPVFEREMYKQELSEGQTTKSQFGLTVASNSTSFNNFLVNGIIRTTDNEDKIISEQKVEELWHFDGTEFNKADTKIAEVPGIRQIIPPRPLAFVVPEFSEKDRKKNIHGEVKVSLEIDVTGKVGKALVIENTTGSERCAQAALRAALASRFTPARNAQGPVKYWLIQPYRFDLKN